MKMMLLLPPQLVVAIFLVLLRSGSANYHVDTVNRRYFGPISPPVFVNPGGTKIKVKVGDTVTIPCKIHNKGDATVIWKQGDRVIFADKIHVSTEMRASIVDRTSLLLRGVDTQYTGNYTCEVEWSPEKAPVTLSHYLEVCVSPSVVAINTEGGSFVDVREGDNVTLECEADGIPRPSIHWISNRWGSQRKEQGAKLNLTATQRTDSGQYTCIATNGVGQPDSAQITLRVQYAPVVTAVPSKVATLEGTRVSLTCSVLSVPKSDVRWFFKRSQLKMDQKHMMEERENNYTLTLENVRESNLGEYTCSAVNKIGDGQAVVFLTGIPFGLDFTSSTLGLYKSSYNLTWTVKTFSPLDETEISYRRVGLGHWTTRSINHLIQSWNYGNYYPGGSSGSDSYSDTPRSISSATNTANDGGNKFHSVSRTGPFAEGTWQFTHLIPNSEYEVKIRERNKYGWSLEEPSFVFKTSRIDPEPQRMSTFSDGISTKWRSHASNMRYVCLSIVLTSYIVTMFVTV